MTTEKKRRPKAGKSPKVKKISKDVNTPGEEQRAVKGMVNRMVSMSEGQFNKMIKNIRAKRR